MQIPQTEAEFQRAVEDLATATGWRWLHVNRMGNERGQWRTPVSGPLGKGWPDLFLVKGSRAIFVECKGNTGILTEAQKSIRLILEQLHPFYVWRPRDWSQILEVLSR